MHEKVYYMIISVGGKLNKNLGFGQNGRPKYVGFQGQNCQKNSLKGSLTIPWFWDILPISWFLQIWAAISWTKYNFFKVSTILYVNDKNEISTQFQTKYCRFVMYQRSQNQIFKQEH